MRKRTVSMSIVCLFLSITWACTNVLANHEESRFFRVYFDDREMAVKQLQQFEVEAYEVFWEDRYHVMKLSPDDVDACEDLHYKVVPFFDYDPHHNRVADPVKTRYETIPGYPSYKIVESTFAIAESLVTTYPKLATFIDAGDSWEKVQGSGGYDLMVLILTNADFPGPKPKLFIGGSIHAREYTTSELDLRFVLYLVENYGKDADVTWMLNYHEFHAMFFINPDGRKHAEDGESWRKNTNTDYCPQEPRYRGCDLNRNADNNWAGSSDECGQTFPGASAASEPEMQGLQSYMDKIFEDNSVKGIYIDLHSYGEIIYLPSAMGTLVRKFSYFNGYDPQDIRPGLAYGYAYYEAGAAACLFELGTSFFQNCDYFENTIIPDNLPAFVYALKACRDPVNLAQGPDAVELAVNGKTLTAKIDDTRYGQTVPTQNITEAEYYITDPPWVPGATAIPMPAADGSFDSKIEEVEATLPEDLPNDREEGIVFVRGKDSDGNWGALSAIFSDQVNTIPNGVEDYGSKVEFTYTNPLRTPATINLTLPKATDVRFRVYNLNGRVITTLVNSKMKAGRHSILWNGRDGLGNELAKGIYLFQLHVDNAIQMGRFVLVR